MYTRLILESRKRNRLQYKNIDFASNDQANELIKDIDRYPHAYLIALLMNYGMPFKRAFDIPFLLKERLGGFTFRRLRSLSQEQISYAMKRPSALHRFPGMMSKRLYQAIIIIDNDYHGDASRIWTNVYSSAEIVSRLLAFPGIGQKKATLGANDLIRCFKIPVTDKSSIDISLDVHIRRVMFRLGLVPAKVSDAQLIFKSRAINPRYPGLIDSIMWQIGREWCRPRRKECGACPMSDLCPSAEN